MERFILRVLVLVLAGVAIGVVFYSRSKVVTGLPPQPAAPVVAPATGATGSTGPVAPTGPAASTGAPAATGAPARTAPAPAGAAASGDGHLKDYLITLDQAKAIFDGHDAIFIDARPYAEFTEGHIRGAMFLDKGHVTQKKVRDYLPGKEVVVYYHGADCTDSEAVVIRLQALNIGIGPFRIMGDGFPGWEARNKADPQGYPIDKGGEVGFE